ncbi:MAG: ABC transporter ATP-binding protein, partial [Oscillospiraceae bacterium]|nr:ABC transporter ATP-binding protein [Oscillospiraceae bacterium]
DATDEEIRRAAITAQADDFISSQPQQYDTPVAESGMSLSGGQRQRIAISRALIKNAEILILDDSTSALDFRTEAALQKALREEFRSMTKIIIAQRISSVRNADRIAVIDNGTIAACDTHDNLMQSCKIYQDIYASQLRKEDA